MRQERRKHQRAQVPGMRVVYDDAAGQRAEADALDVGAGGVFVRCDQPAPAGKGLSLELVLQDGSARLSVLGRVAWVRSEAAAAGPAGMAIRFLDAEPAVLARIEQLVASRERTEPGTGGAKTPAREPTVLGVGSAQTPQAAAAPIIAVAPAREKTVLGVGAPEAATPRTIHRGEPSLGVPPPEDGWESASDDQAATEPESPPMPERSMPIELVTTKAKVDPPAPSEASLVVAGVPRRRSRAWPAVLVILLAAGCAAYFFRARIPWVRTMLERSGLIAASQPVTAPPPAPSPQPLVAIPAPSAAPSASPSASSVPVASASALASAPAKSAPTASVSASATAKPAKKSAPKPPPAQSSASKAVDNPY